LKAGEWFRRGRLLMVSPVHGDYRRYQAETPLIALSRFPRPALLWIARTGSPWRDLPKQFGKWNSVFVRYRDWGKAGVFKHLFEAASDEPDMEYAMVDATIVKVHRHGQGAKGGRKIRRSASPRAV
jgi:Putative transposase of IS4/5 family (DUF4096)